MATSCDRTLGRIQTLKDCWARAILRPEEGARAITTLRDRMSAMAETERPNRARNGGDEALAAGSR